MADLTKEERAWLFFSLMGGLPGLAHAVRIYSTERGMRRIDIDALKAEKYRFDNAVDMAWKLLLGPAYDKIEEGEDC